MLRRKTQLMRCSSEQGFSLLEALVAIMVIAIILAVIAPPILLAAATRIRNQRVEQATQLARGEIDRIRLLVERGQYSTTDLPPSSTTNPIQNTDAPAPISNNNNLNNPAASRTSPTQSFSVDLNPNQAGDEFVVQTFREQGQQNNNIPVAFRMGVRVYSAQAFANGASPTQKIPLSIGFTSGVNLQNPLAVLYTPIVKSDRYFSLCAYRKLNNSSAQCP